MASSVSPYGAFDPSLGIILPPSGVFVSLQSILDTPSPHPLTEVSSELPRGVFEPSQGIILLSQGVFESPQSIFEISLPPNYPQTPSDYF